jgi:hypothetical protein
MNRGKVFVRAEKRLACDLRPGDLFVLELPDHEYFSRELNGDKVAVMVMLRTNVADYDIDDREEIVYRLEIVTTLPGEVAPARLDPHSPPGMKDE